MSSLGIVWNFKGDSVPHIQAIHEYMGISTLVLYSCQVCGCLGRGQKACKEAVRGHGCHGRLGV